MCVSVITDYSKLRDQIVNISVKRQGPEITISVISCRRFHWLSVVTGEVNRIFDEFLNFFCEITMRNHKKRIQDFVKRERKPQSHELIEKFKKYMKKYKQYISEIWQVEVVKFVSKNGINRLWSGFCSFSDATDSEPRS